MSQNYYKREHIAMYIYKCIILYDTKFSLDSIFYYIQYSYMWCMILKPVYIVYTIYVLFQVRVFTEACDRRLSGHCYRLIRQSLNRTEAKQYCRNIHGNLVTVDSQEKNDLIISIRNAYGTFKIYLHLQTYFIYILIDKYFKGHWQFNTLQR